MEILPVYTVQNENLIDKGGLAAIRCVDSDTQKGFLPKVLRSQLLMRSDVVSKLFNDFKMPTFILAFVADFAISGAIRSFRHARRLQEDRLKADRFTRWHLLPPSADAAAAAAPADDAAARKGTGAVRAADPCPDVVIENLPGTPALRTWCSELESCELKAFVKSHFVGLPAAAAGDDDDDTGIAAVLTTREINLMWRSAMVAAKQDPSTAITLGGLLASAREYAAQLAVYSSMGLDIKARKSPACSAFVLIECVANHAFIVERLNSDAALG